MFHTCQNAPGLAAHSTALRAGSVVPSPCNRTSQIYNRNQQARVVELADAPGLGKPNQRFQNVAFQFEKQSIYERETLVLARLCNRGNGEQKTTRSSTNSSTDAPEFGPVWTRILPVLC
jgi:hypothetical protein